MPRVPGLSWRPPRQTLPALVILLALLSLAGCSALKIRHPVPESLSEEARIEGIPGARAFGDAWSPVFQQSLMDAITQRVAENARTGAPGGAAILALSGGGADGAFGAGFLCGWTKAGTRPDFLLVTGVSTGALIAPFAFLGPAYDETLRAVYTTISSKDIFFIKSLLTILRDDSVADTAPLARLAEKYIDETLLAAIAAEHKKGRRLYVGTTNLDAQRSVVWDMGAIAASGQPGALDLFRKVLVASASVPVAFPPVYIPVAAGGKKYDEMHVDGGAITQVFLYGPFIDPREAAKVAGINYEKVEKDLYVIINNKIDPVYEEVRPRLTAIAQRSVSSLIKGQAVGALYAMYAVCQRDGIVYNLASIPGDYTDTANETFDRAAMNRLFNLGHDLAAAGYDWRPMPPSFQPENGKAAPGGAEK